MFHPRTFAIGDRVTITRAFTNHDGLFDAGHEFEITYVYPLGGEALYDLRDRELHVLMRVPFDALAWRE